jgi:hypothetical protein
MAAVPDTEVHPLYYIHLYSSMRVLSQAKFKKVCSNHHGTFEVPSGCASGAAGASKFATSSLRRFSLAAV